VVLFLLFWQIWCTDYVLFFKDKDDLMIGKLEKVAASWKMENPGTTETTVTVPLSRHLPSCFPFFADNHQRNGKLPVATLNLRDMVYLHERVYLV
jgi:hypothetical protein